MRYFLIVTVVAALSAPVWADEFREFTEFRYSSGLPGGGYGVDPAGHAGFDGAFQMNIPVGYTPGAGNYSFAASVADFTGNFPTDWEGDDVNGTFAWGLGLFGEHALWLMDMGTGNGGSLESAYNVQFQVKRETANHPGIAIGVVDLFNERSATVARPGEGAGKSFFIVATREAGTEEKPMYYTLGYGNGRFHNRPFGGVSYQPQPRWKLFGEYDGWNPNFGTAYDLWHSGEQFHLIGMLGVVDWDRINIGLTLTRTGL
ncbi:MAG: hypothetical protein ABFE07_10485 [Armatimonadia bacterium]